jgi:hypothetical protein
MTRLPPGWTLARLRAASGDREATSLTLQRRVLLELHGGTDHVELQPEFILGFHDLCLVRADDEWHMGQLGADGSIVCWACYGDDLEAAIRGL